MITHFSLGLAVASFFKEVVLKSTMGVPLLALGGAFALLPDFLDFKFWKFMEKYDYVADPDPNDPDPKMIAETIAKAIDDAYESGRMVRVKLHTMQLGFDHWRQYQVEFDQQGRKIRVRIGPVVSTGKVPYPETEPPKEKAVGEAETKHPFLKIYPKPTVIDIFTGPSMGFKREGDIVKIHFIPFHREWSHSFTVGALLGAIVALIGGMSLGLMAMIAFWSHVVSDQVGFLGCNLFWPFTKERTPGFKLAESAHPAANFSTVWASITTVIWNINRYAEQQIIFMDPSRYFTMIVFLPPALIIGATSIYYRKIGRPVRTALELEAEEALTEEEGPFKEGG